MKIATLICFFAISSLIGCSASTFQAGTRSAELDDDASSTIHTNANGNPIDSFGNPLDSLGNPVLFDTNGSPIDSFGNPITTPILDMNGIPIVYDPALGTNPDGSTGTNIGDQTGINTVGTNPNGTTSDETNPDGSTGTTIGDQTGTNGGGTISSEEGKPCTEGDIINLQQLPADVLSCNAAGLVYNYLENKCSAIPSVKASCSWDELNTILSTTSFENSSASAYIQTFNNLRSEGAKLVDCGIGRSSSQALVVQIVQSSYDKTSCTYQKNPVYTLCYVGDSSTVPSSIGNDGDALVKWCLTQ